MGQIIIAIVIISIIGRIISEAVKNASSQNQRNISQRPEPGRNQQTKQQKMITLEDLRRRAQEKWEREKDDSRSLDERADLLNRKQEQKTTDSRFIADKPYADQYRDRPGFETPGRMESPKDQISRIFEKKIPQSLEEIFSAPAQTREKPVPTKSKPPKPRKPVKRIPERHSISEQIEIMKRKSEEKKKKTREKKKKLADKYSSKSSIEIIRNLSPWQQAVVMKEIMGKSKSKQR